MSDVIVVWLILTPTSFSRFLIYMPTSEWIILEKVLYLFGGFNSFSISFFSSFSSILFIVVVVVKT